MAGRPQAMQVVGRVLSISKLPVVMTRTIAEAQAHLDNSRLYPVDTKMELSLRGVEAKTIITKSAQA